MNTNNQDPPAPPRRIRLLCWFGIYVVAQLPLIPWVYHANAWLWLLFPMGMEYGLLCLVWEIIPRSILDAGGDQHNAQILQGCVGWVTAVLPWVTYVTHLICTLCIRRRRSFLILIWLLAGIVLFNTAGCAYFFHSPPE